MKASVKRQVTIIIRSNLPAIFSLQRGEISNQRLSSLLYSLHGSNGLRVNIGDALHVLLSCLDYDVFVAFPMQTVKHYVCLRMQ